MSVAGVYLWPMDIVRGESGQAGWALVGRPVSVRGVGVDRSFGLVGRVVVFTRALAAMDRRLAWEECVRVGAVPARRVTAATGVVVVGNVDPPAPWPASFKVTAKTAKAVRLQRGGHGVELWTENAFLASVGRVGAMSPLPFADADHAGWRL